MHAFEALSQRQENHGKAMAHLMAPWHHNCMSVEHHVACFKAHTCILHRRSRRENREKAMAHLMAGNAAAAEECFQRAVDVTPRMAKQVIEVSWHQFGWSHWSS